MRRQTDQRIRIGFYSEGIRRFPLLSPNDHVDILRQNVVPEVSYGASCWDLEVYQSGLIPFSSYLSRIRRDGGRLNLFVGGAPSQPFDEEMFAQYMEDPHPDDTNLINTLESAGMSMQISGPVLMEQHSLASNIGGYQQLKSWIESIGGYSDRISITLLTNPIFLDGMVNRDEGQLRNVIASLEPCQRERVIFSEDFSEILERGS
ncbi:hypothetical protein HOC80_03085 [archaeon]|jgi:hypothetical protein|nr:hypothetical protein [archaeon]MBT4417064.1 hypothetical protein [archaeon]